jgi:hypothetical protein
MNSKHKLAIAYRIYPKVSKVPPVYSDDKYKLSELCLSSFIRATSKINCKVWVILDACPDEYRELFSKNLKCEYELIDMPGVGNPGTFGKQMEILLNQTYSENIYFAEDDYFYLENAFEEMLEFFESPEKPDFVTPYDHLDYYNLDIHNLPNKKTIDHKNTNWRDEGATCMTFLTSKRVLKETFDVFHSYTKKNYDASLWLTLTKKRILNPLLYPKYLLSDFHLFKIFAKAWVYTPMNVALGKKRSLYAPVPSLSTHMDSLYLAPGIDWYSIFENEKKSLFV